MEIVRKFIHKAKKLVSSTAGTLQRNLASNTLVADLEGTSSPLAQQKQKLIFGAIGATVLILIVVLILSSSALTNQFVAGEFANPTNNATPVNDSRASGGSYVKFNPAVNGGDGKKAIIGLHGAGGTGDLIAGFGSCGNYPEVQGVLTLAAPNTLMNYDDVNSMRNYLNSLADQNDIDQIILHGFSMGGAAVHRLAAAQETLNGRVVGYIVDDPAGSGVSGNPGKAAGTQAVVYYNNPGPTVGYSQAMANEIDAEWKENIYYDGHHPITRHTINCPGTPTPINGDPQGPFSAPEEQLTSSWWRGGGPVVTPTPTPTPTPPVGGGSCGVTTAIFRSTRDEPSACLRYKTSSTLLWNKLLPATSGGDIDPNSAGIVAAITRLAQGNGTLGGAYPAYWENRENAPAMYVVNGNSVPLSYVRYAGEGYCGLGPWLPGNVSEPAINDGIPGRPGVPIPDGVNVTKGNAGSDSPLAIYDYVNDVQWNFWVYDSGAKTYCWGGVIRNFSQSNGTFPYPYGEDTAGFTDFGTNVTMEDIKSGSINHVVSLSVQNVRGSGSDFSWPATRANAWCESSGVIPSVRDAAGGVQNCVWVGQYLRLPANFDTSGIGNPVTRMLAEAVKKYGFIIHDTGGGVGVQAESDLSVPGTNAWGALGMGGLSDFPWSSLQVLRKDFGRP